MSVASLHALAPALDGAVPDARRFRMTLTVDGVDAWAEEAWKDRELAVGGAVLRVDDPVPRCVVTTRDPDDGHRDVPVLKALAELRAPLFEEKVVDHVLGQVKLVEEPVSKEALFADEDDAEEAKADQAEAAPAGESNPA